MTQAYDPNPFSGYQEGGGANTEAPSGGGGSSTTSTTTTPSTTSASSSVSKPASSFPWGKVLLGLAGAAAAYFVGVKFFGGKR